MYGRFFYFLFLFYSLLCLLLYSWYSSCCREHFKSYLILSICTHQHIDLIKNLKILWDEGMLVFMTMKKKTYFSAEGLQVFKVFTRQNLDFIWGKCQSLSFQYNWIHIKSSVSASVTSGGDAADCNHLTPPPLCSLLTNAGSESVFVCLFVCSGWFCNWRFYFILLNPLCTLDL